MEIKIKNLQKTVPIHPAAILKEARRALVKLSCGLSGLSLVFVGKQRMRAVNKKYLNHDYVTDVLTFDLGSGWGEIIICPQVARSHARFFKTSTDDEIILYTIHGLLHLSGFDDQTEADQRIMRKMEERLLGER